MRASFVVSVKAFGDFVIACNCLRRVDVVPDGRVAPKVIAGDHLTDLARALGLENEVRFISTGGKYPAAYDVGGRGIWSALASLLAMRKQFSSLPRDCDLILHSVRWRERVLANRFTRFDFSAGRNVYISLSDTLCSVGFGLQPVVSSPCGPGAALTPGRVAIFPSSRVAKKCIPAAVLQRVVGQLRAAGLECDVVRLGDETLDLPDQISARSIERSFESLIRTVQSCNLVVSADSLPAHLAEYLGVPTYVISPAPNEYWLPLSAFVDKSWSVFDDQHALALWLSRRCVAPATVSPWR